MDALYKWWLILSWNCLIYCIYFDTFLEDFSCIFRILDFLVSFSVQNWLESKDLIIFIFILTLIYIYYLNFQTKIKLYQSWDYQVKGHTFWSIMFFRIKQLSIFIFYHVPILSFFILLHVITTLELVLPIFLFFLFPIIIFSFSCIVQMKLFLIFIFKVLNNLFYLIHLSHLILRVEAFWFIFWFPIRLFFWFVISWLRIVTSYLKAARSLKILR